MFVLETSPFPDVQWAHTRPVMALVSALMSYARTKRASYIPVEGNARSSHSRVVILKYLKYYACCLS